LGNVMEVYGQFSYATVTRNPVGLEHAARDTFLPLIKVPDAIFIGDVVP